MEIKKAAGVLETGVPTPEQLARINKLTKSELSAQEVYIFAVRLCDNQPDRDMERFSDRAVRELAPMFVGKTGVLDHTWSAEKQMGRIFHTEVVENGEILWLKAWVYMLRSEKTEGLIREIEGGIKKEVSVGCAMGATRCSICGEEYGDCQHRKGQVYGGETCLAVLDEPVDAYEFSFVAVPAQKDAGVVKAAKGNADKLRKLEKEAEYGRMYRKMLEKDVVKMGQILDLGIEESTWLQMVMALDMEGLVLVQSAFSKKAAEKIPLHTQLSDTPQTTRKTDSAYLI